MNYAQNQRFDSKMIEVFGPEYGIERTEEGDKWTLNEAIDDDIIENFIYPRMNSASHMVVLGRECSDIIAPRGPTELTNDDATIGATSDNEDEEQLNSHLSIRSNLKGPATIDIENGRAKLSYPLRTPAEEAAEQEVQQRSKPLMAPMMN